MTKERMIELLEIERECMRRGAHGACDRDCANCELVQDDRDLDEMYTSVLCIMRELVEVRYAAERFSCDNTVYRKVNDRGESDN